MIHLHVREPKTIMGSYCRNCENTDTLKGHFYHDGQSVIVASSSNKEVINDMLPQGIG